MAAYSMRRAPISDADGVSLGSALFSKQFLVMVDLLTLTSTENNRGFQEGAVLLAFALVQIAEILMMTMMMTVMVLTQDRAPALCAVSNSLCLNSMLSPYRGFAESFTFRCAALFCFLVVLHPQSQKYLWVSAGTAASDKDVVFSGSSLMAFCRAAALRKPLDARSNGHNV